MGKGIEWEEWARGAIGQDEKGCCPMDPLRTSPSSIVTSVEISVFVPRTTNSDYVYVKIFFTVKSVEALHLRTCRSIQSLSTFSDKNTSHVLRSKNRSQGEGWPSSLPPSLGARLGVLFAVRSEPGRFRSP